MFGCGADIDSEVHAGSQAFHTQAHAAARPLCRNRESPPSPCSTIPASWPEITGGARGSRSGSRTGRSCRTGRSREEARRGGSERRPRSGDRGGQGGRRRETPGGPCGRGRTAAQRRDGSRPRRSGTSSHRGARGGGLPHSGDAEEARVERLGLGLSARRHRKLDVVDGPDHGTTLPDRLATTFTWCCYSRPPE